MAIGFIKPQSATVRARVDEAKAAYASNRRLLDVLIEAKAVDNATLQAALGEADTTAALKVFDNLDAAMAGLTTAYNALSKMDGNAL